MFFSKKSRFGRKFKMIFRSKSERHWNFMEKKGVYLAHKEVSDSLASVRHRFFPHSLLGFSSAKKWFPWVTDSCARRCDVCRGSDYTWRVLSCGGQSSERTRQQVVLRWKTGYVTQTLFFCGALDSDGAGLNFKVHAAIFFAEKWFCYDSSVFLLWFGSGEKCIKCFINKDEHGFHR